MISTMGKYNHVEVEKFQIGVRLLRYRQGRRDYMINTPCGNYKGINWAMSRFRRSCLCRFVFRFCSSSKSDDPRRSQVYWGS